MSAEENFAIDKKVIVEFNQGNFNILDEVCSPSYVWHGPSMPDLDREGIKAALRMMQAAFPDLQNSLDDIVATADKVAIRVSCQGTHLGELWGVPPTGKKMTWSAIIIDHFSNGQIVEEWEWMDFLGLMRQLGLIPESVGV
jgi:predicted ester cyclase